MYATVYKTFELEVAIRLPNVAETIVCKQLHGHRLVVTLFVHGPIHPILGWVEDTRVIKQCFTPLKAALDHHYLNDVPGLENPTAEHVAQWIMDRLKPDLPFLSSVRVQDTSSSFAQVNA